jgi:FkbM family methyltransferase
LLKAILRPGMSFVDVGANWGYFTLLAAHIVGTGGRVISLEPDPRLFDVLKENLARNELRHVTALQVAAANERGTLTLAGYDERGENWGLSKLVAQPDSKANTFAVTACSLDMLLDDLGIDGVDLLKMDIEGAEALAVEGMRAGLARHRYRRILLEVHPAILAEQGRTTEEVLNLLIAAGYKGWWIDHSQAAIRRAAYSRSINPADYLKPLASSSNIDAWPHILWSVPGLELSR